MDDAQPIKVSNEPELANALFDLVEQCFRYSRAWWRFWEQDELAYARIYSEALLLLIKTGTLQDLDRFIHNLARGEVHPFTMRLLNQLYRIRPEEEQHPI